MCLFLRGRLHPVLITELFVGGPPCAMCHQTCETLIIRHTIISGTIKGRKADYETSWLLRHIPISEMLKCGGKCVSQRRWRTVRTNSNGPSSWLLTAPLRSRILSAADEGVCVFFNSISGVICVLCVMHEVIALS